MSDPWVTATEIDDVVYSPQWEPYSGWANTGVNAAFQQIRSEFLQFVDILNYNGIAHGDCLQLGMGLSDCSHAVWQLLFERVATVDLRICKWNNEEFRGEDTHSFNASKWVKKYAPYDLLFIDAGHSFGDVSRDYNYHKQFVREGGMIAFHDALHRPLYPDHEVWEYLTINFPKIEIIGNDVGIAWLMT